MNSKKLKDEVYLSSHQAGELLGYTHDYISRLCRQGHMVGDRRGREWFVKPSDIEVFKKNHEIILQEKKKQLSQKLSQIRKEHEAQKRAQKTTVTPKKTQTQTQTPQPSQPTQGVKISIPRQFVAICILACVLMLPTISNTLSFPSNISISNDIPVVVKKLQTANIVDSYGSSIAQIPQETYKSLSKIGHVYLKFYLLQGEAFTQTFYDIQNTGAVTLAGYELVGESFVQGFQNAIKYFSPSVEVGIDTVKKKLNWYVSNVSEGFLYAQNSFSVLYDTFAFTYVIKGGSIIATNVQSNVSAMQSILQLSSHTVLGNISSIFESSFSKKESPEIIKIEN